MYPYGKFGGWQKVRETRICSHLVRPWHTHTHTHTHSQSGEVETGGSLVFTARLV